MMAKIEELAEPPALGRLYGRAVAGMLPGRGRAGDTLPDTTLVLRGVRADLGRLADYSRVCGFRLADTLPPTYPHVLAFPLALSLMTRADFPFPAAGVVHLANRITQHRPLPVEQPFDLAVHAEGLRPHARGRQVDVVAEATVDGELVWRDVSTYLRKDPSASREGALQRTSPEEGAAPHSPSPQQGAPAQARTDGGAPSRERGEDPPTAIWRVGAGLGRDYAAVSGDRNPIHTSTLAARAFGFRRRIAHGMWSKARCLAQLAPRLPAAYEAGVVFAAPILLPSTVHFAAGAADDGWTVAVHAPSGKPHLSGWVRALAL